MHRTSKSKWETVNGQFLVMNSFGMKRRLASMLSAGFIICLAFAGLVDGVPENCRMQSCDRPRFDSAVQDYCIPPFSESMANTDYQLKCPWPGTKRYYVELMQCLDSVGSITCCTHASYTQHLLDIHELYFSLCSLKKDPPIVILLLLAVPCSLISLLIPLLFQHYKLYETKLPHAD
ncbi:hypothetical protein DNTS_024881 [Danionella cerebrum]|uniref:Uncharacterized protein n=1 Tax=Danionella cerebrum TaxID=2873325 RepID=A0A553QS75_9TELE|nr:hypothetical protein DNTS_024881 [Danionella translucida]